MARENRSTMSLKQSENCLLKIRRIVADMFTPDWNAENLDDCPETFHLLSSGLCNFEIMANTAWKTKDSH